MCSEVAELKSMYQFVGTYILEPAACLWIHGLSFDRRQFNLRTKMEGCYKSVGEVIIVIKNNGKAGKLSPDQFLDARVLFFQRSEEHTSELQSRGHLVCRLLLEKEHRVDQPGRRLRRHPDGPVGALRRGRGACGSRGAHRVRRARRCRRVRPADPAR